MLFEKKKMAMINIAMYILMVLFNFAGAMGLINSMSQKDVSNKYDTILTPPGFAFGIWSIIYTLLLATVLYSYIQMEKQKYYENFIETSSKLFWISCVINIVWIITFSYEMIFLSFIAICGFLYVNVRLSRNIYLIREPKRILLPLTFGLYTGWIFIATFINFAAFLKSIEFNYFGMTEQLFSVILVILIVAFNFALYEYIKNAAFNLPIIWAFFALLTVVNSLNEFFIIKIVLIMGFLFLIFKACLDFYYNNNDIIPNGLQRTRKVVLNIKRKSN